jgi:hypothetical protein
MREQLITTKPVLWQNARFAPRVQVGRAACKMAGAATPNKPVEMEASIMNRLPCCDRTTRRSETAVFASLGLAGLISISVAASAFVKFVGGSDRPALRDAAFTEPSGSVAGAPAALTNVTIIQSRRTPTATATPGKV